MFTKPELEKFPGYTRGYIKMIPDGDIIDILSNQLETTYNLLSEITKAQADYRYKEGKWTLSEVLGHLTDTERIMTYRILRIARGDTSPLLGFNENEFVKEASFPVRTMGELLEDYQNVRRATISLLKGLPRNSLQYQGKANGYDVSVETIAYMIAGHELHHLNIINERYL